MKKNICVFCSSAADLATAHHEEAKNLGDLLGKNHYNLVYGGTDVGLMKTVADAANQSGAEITGVIPEAIVEMGIASKQCSELLVCADMSARKQLLDKKSDAFIALPGGFGTLDEFSEVLANKQVGTHRKPLVLLNANGFYDGLTSWFESLYAGKFAKEQYRELFFVANTANEAIDFLEEML